MANVDKIFYQRAADEVIRGHLDPALLIKVRADNPHADDKAVQALYVQARAAELSVEHGRDTIKRIGSTAVAKTGKAIKDTRDAIFDTIRWALKWSLVVVPLFVLLFGWDVRRDAQYHYETLATQIDTFDQAAARNNYSDYEKTGSGAATTCNELAAISTKALNFFADQSKEAAVRERCDRLTYIVNDFNNHADAIKQGQFALKTVEKL